MSVVKQIRYRIAERPLKVTFATALGSKDLIRSVLVKVVLDDGLLGEGEIPTSFAFQAESIQAIVRKLQKWIPVFDGMLIDDYRDAIRNLRHLNPGFPMTLSGLEVALFRSWLLSRGVCEAEYWGAKKESLRTDITIPYTPARERLLKWLRTAIRLKFTEFKVKISGSYREDIAFLDLIYAFLREEMCEKFGPARRNQGYGPGSFLRLMDWCDGKGYIPELIEQPLPRHDFTGMREIAERTVVPVILDEGVVTVSDLMRALDARACGGINIKIAKSGIDGSERLLSVARVHGLKIMAGCMTETMTGLSAAIHMAAGTGCFDYIDLDSIHFLFHEKHYGLIELKGPEYKIHGPKI